MVNKVSSGFNYQITTSGYKMPLMATPHEGDRLRQLLQAHGRSQSDLARACDVSSAMVSKYVKSESFGPGALETVNAGLKNLGIDPQALRPSEPPLGIGGPGPNDYGREVREIMYILPFLTRSQLESLHKLFGADLWWRNFMADFIVNAIEILDQKQLGEGPREPLPVDLANPFDKSPVGSEIQKRNR